MSLLAWQVEVWAILLPFLAIQPFVLLHVKTVVCALLLTHVLALLAGLGQLVMKVRLYVAMCNSQ